MSSGVPLQALLSEKRFADVEEAFRYALLEPRANVELILQALRGVIRAGPKEKARLKAMVEEAVSALKGEKDPAVARLRWTILKEAVRAGATPSAADGFHRLFEEVLRGAYPDAPSLPTLLGHFRFRDAKEPADGLNRMEKAERWLPFGEGRVFSMPGHGAGKVIETNFTLDVVRLDFETARGISVPIGVAQKTLVPLPEGHFLREKLTDPKGLGERLARDPSATLKHLVDSFGRALTMGEIKEAVHGLLPEESWSSWWTAARKHPQVVVQGSGKNATVEWSASADAADETLRARFGRAHLKERVELFRRNHRRSPELALFMGQALAKEAEALKASDPARAFEVAALVEDVPGVSLAVEVEDHLLASPLVLLPQLQDRMIRERVLELHATKRPAEAPGILSEWFFREEDGRTLEWIDRRLSGLDPQRREQTLDKLVKSPRSAPRAFFWFVQRAATDETLRPRLGLPVLTRLLDAVTWDELGPLRARVREMFDRTGLAAAWLVKQATAEEARTFVEALGRHHELEPHRRTGLVAAAEMRFPELRRGADDTFFVTPEAIEARRRELENILQVEIPENTKGIALAASEGDLTENFEYKARRERQQLLSVRAGKLQEELTRARPLDPATIDTSEVRPGSRVTLRAASGPRVVTLLGPWDSKPEEGVFSYLSDLGKALLGKTVGEMATVLGGSAVVEKIEAWR